MGSKAVRGERGPKAKSFRWTPAEWAILEPLSEAQRTALALRAMFSQRGLIGQARHEGLIGDDDTGTHLRRAAKA